MDIELYVLDLIKMIFKCLEYFAYAAIIIYILTKFKVVKENNIKTIMIIIGIIIIVLYILQYLIQLLTGAR